VLVFSQDDVSNDHDLMHRYASMVKTMVVTHGRFGSTVYRQGEHPRHFPAFSAHEVDPTGAGDVFCAAYLIRMRETGDPYESARFANCTASFAVEGLGIATLPSRQQVDARLRQGHSSHSGSQTAAGS